MKAFKLTHTNRAIGIFTTYKTEGGLKRLFKDIRANGSCVWCDNDLHRAEAKTESDFVSICKEGDTFVYFFRDGELVDGSKILVENIEID